MVTYQCFLKCFYSCDAHIVSFSRFLDVSPIYIIEHFVHFILYISCLSYCPYFVLCLLYLFFDVCHPFIQGHKIGCSSQYNLQYILCASNSPTTLHAAPQKFKIFSSDPYHKFQICSSKLSRTYELRT